MDSGDHGNDNDGDNLGSVGSIEAPTPDSKSANDSDDVDHMNLSSAELSLSSPPVPNDYHIIPHHSSRSPNHHHDLFIRGHGSSLASLPNLCPPRNSPINPNNPLSIERLTMSHCPSMRNSLGSNHNSIITSNCTGLNTSTGPASVGDIAIPQLPTPPSTDSSSAHMLTVA